MNELYELRWRTTFIWYYWRFSGYEDDDFIFWVEQCFRENHDGKHRILSPKQAAQEIINWMRK